MARQDRATQERVERDANPDERQIKIKPRFSIRPRVMARPRFREDDRATQEHGTRCYLPTVS
jgi:hypothetical protein